MEMTRRSFLIAAAAAAGGGLGSCGSGGLKPGLADDPFQLGIASGDPSPDGVVLWTRLAPRRSGSKTGTSIISRASARESRCA